MGLETDEQWLASQSHHLQDQTIWHCQMADLETVQIPKNTKLEETYHRGCSAAEMFRN
jgi:hypothetical protein